MKNYHLPEKIRPISTIYEKSLRNMIFAMGLLPPITKRPGAPPKIEIFQKSFLIQPRYAKSQAINHAPGVFENITFYSPLLLKGYKMCPQGSYIGFQRG